MVIEPTSFSAHPAMSSSNTTVVPSTIPPSFSKMNYLLWRLQLPAIRAARLEDLFDVEKVPPKTLAEKSGEMIIDNPNPAYVAWMTRDEALLGSLLLSVTRDVLMGLTTITTSAAAWNALAEMFAPRTRARSVNTRIALTMTKKGTSTMLNFIPT
jgi:hypothetical protein